MPAFLIDTNVLIHAIRGKKGRRELIRKLLEDGHTMAYSAITLGELHAGMKSHEAVLTANILDSMTCYPATCDLFKRAGEIKRTRSALGFQHTLLDMVILATATENNLTLVTENANAFPMKSIYPVEQ